MKKEILDFSISIFCDPECAHLSLKEKDQANTKQPHICKKYKTKLLHKQFHPHLIRLDICTYDTFLKIKRYCGLKQ